LIEFISIEFYPKLLYFHHSW